MPDDYGYINARIRAMKSFILQEEDYSLALSQRTEDEFLGFLSALSSYANDIRQMERNQSRKSVCDGALKLNLCRIFRKLIKFCEGEPLELILILLKRWDLYNLKSIIRGILNHKDKTQILEALIPAGKWEREFLERLLENKDLKSLGLTLGGTGEPDFFDEEFAQVLIDFSPDESLEVLEKTLLEAYFRKAIDFLLTQKNINARIILDYLFLKIDFLNIFLVLRKITHPERSVRVIKGGRIPISFLENLLALKSLEDALKSFADSIYPWINKEGLDLYNRTQSLSSLERLFEHKLFSFCANLYIRGNPLSISIPLAFISFKENEIKNLRLIGKAVSFGIAKDLIRGELIYAG